MLKIDYKLVGTGWVECYVTGGSRKVIITASYLGDALYELAEATLEILQGKNKARADFEEEPGQFRWIFTRKSKNIKIEIREFDDFWSKEPDGKGKLLFSHLCNTEEFAASIFKCIDDVFRRHSLRSYKNKWCWEFPLHQHKELKKLLKDSN
jgi:hypothetical protein